MRCVNAFWRPGWPVFARRSSWLLGPWLKQSLTVHRRFDVPLPKNVTTSDDWLDMGEDNSAPVGSMNKYSHMDNNDSLDQIQAGPYLGQNW